jgi:hypothetical protein
VIDVDALCVAAAFPTVSEKPPSGNSKWKKQTHPSQPAGRNSHPRGPSIIPPFTEADDKLLVNLIASLGYSEPM